MYRFKNVKRRSTFKTVFRRKPLQSIVSRKRLDNCSIGHQRKVQRLHSHIRKYYFRSTGIEKAPEVSSANSNRQQPDVNYSSDSSDIAFDSLCSDWSDNSSDSYVDENPIPHQDNLQDFEARLCDAFQKSNINLTQMKEILNVLHNHPCFETMHKDPRTILSTPRTCQSTQLFAGGEYLHLGLENAIRFSLQLTTPNLIPDILQIDVSTDEASLDRLSNILIWPIQIRISNIPESKPQVVGIWKGSCKPTSPVELMKPFVDEFLSIISKGGIIFKEKKISVQIRCVIADAPARAFILGHSGHNSHVPCSRCWVVGEYIRSSRVMVFRGTDHRPRTDEEYAQKIDGSHHKEGEGSLDRLSINLVSQTIFDYMHLVCLGVMEKIFFGLVQGKYARSAKLRKNDVTTLSARLQQVAYFCPTDFARKPVNVLKHNKFKATELRQILLYSGPAVFLGLANSALYLHFLLLHTSLRTFVHPSPYEHMVDIAESFIKIFVDRAEEIYGLEFLTYVTHGLLHLAQDVRNFGPLDLYSAFPYENNMMFFRRVCKKNNQHLQQISNRTAERKIPKVTGLTDRELILSGKHNNGPIPENDVGRYCQFSKLIFKSLSLSLKNSDNTVLLEDSRICIIKNILQRQSGQCYLAVNIFDKVEDSYSCGCISSSSVGIYKCSSLSNKIVLITLDENMSKCFRMPSFFENSSRCVQNEFIVAKIISHN